MTRNASRRPPILEDLQSRASSQPARRKPPSARSQLVRSRVFGRHDRLGSAEVRAVMRRVAAGDPASLLGLAPMEGLTAAEVAQVARDVWGWDSGDSSVSMSPDLGIAAFEAARERVVDVAKRGGRIAIGTTRPASLLGIHLGFARLAKSLGGDVLETPQAGPFDTSARVRARLWWIEGVAVMTDGDGLLGDPSPASAREMLFDLPPPDLVVGDRGIAGGAAAAGVEVVALADLDAVALAVAASRGLPITVVPLNERRSPSSYAPLVKMLAAEDLKPENIPT